MLDQHAELLSVDSEEDREFRAEVRSWIEANAPPEICHSAYRITVDDLRPWHRALYDRGWIAPHWPTDAGGMGASLTQQIILYEEMARIGVPTPYPHGLNFIGPTLIAVGTPEQKAKHLPPILTGEVAWCQGYSEPNAGSDLASLRMRAELDGDDFILNGQKIWTTNGHEADWMFALVRTDADAKPCHAGITMLLIDLRSPGITIRPIPSIKGDVEFAEEFFEDVRVPRANMLGDLNDGWRVANLVLGSERFTTGHPRNAMSLIEKARRVAEATGVIDDPGFCDRLAALEIEVTAFVAFYRHAATLHAAGQAPMSMAPIIKIVGGERAQDAADMLMEAAGEFNAVNGPIETPDGPVDPAAELFETRRLTIGSGTPQIQRNILSKRVLELPS